MTKNEITVKIEAIHRLQATLLDDLKVSHPNHCSSCTGQGGVITSCGDGWHEPQTQEWEDCKDCFAQGKHPLDLTKTMSDEEGEAWVEAIFEMGASVPEILVKIEETAQELEALGEHLMCLELWELERA